MKRISKEVGIKVYIIRAKFSLRYDTLYIFHSLSLPGIGHFFAFSAVCQVFFSPILASGLPSDITGGEEYFG